MAVLANVHSFAVGGAIYLRRPWRRVLNDDTKDKILFKSLIDKCQPVQKLNRITGDDRRIASPPAAAKLHVTSRFILSPRCHFELFLVCHNETLLQVQGRPLSGNSLQDNLSLNKTFLSQKCVKEG